MNYLYINNQYITSFQELKECFLQEEARHNNSSLFNELKEYYQSGEIADFLNDIGEEHVAERIRTMEIGGSDTRLMQQLVAAITGTEHDVDFDPMSCLEVLETTVKDSKAIFKMRVLKWVNEMPFEVSINQPAILESKIEIVDLRQYQQGDEIVVEKNINRYHEVCFGIGKVEIGRANPESMAYKNCDTIEGIIDYLEYFPEGRHYGEIKARKTVWNRWFNRNPITMILLPMISFSSYPKFAHSYIKFALFNRSSHQDLVSTLWLEKEIASLVEQNASDEQLNQYLVSTKMFHNNIIIDECSSAFVDDAIEFWIDHGLFP